MAKALVDIWEKLIEELADKVAERIQAKNNDIGPIQLETVVDRPDEDWRADCLAVINQLAPTHGRQIRALLAKFDGAKRLSEVPAVSLPVLLTELALLNE
ncbi:hypothetical protein [Herbiconiux daphne]|uniref:Uncharacterized protein n=1 Tax=Herbiconiux daphne TaxID=2970914 RepID=A0ABT2H9X5_9MICO|nr:hypothetical protein [Herbiconiux daphne]MCS5736755.1 hypothetical protein [Herbiconiux daphne]